jgi:hypothetical protein
MKIRRLIDQLQAFTTEHPEVADAEILTEGYDAWNGNVGVAIREDGCELLTREDTA